MQSDPSKQGYDNYGNTYVNQYPPMNQPQLGTENIYPPNYSPPGYSQYPSQPIGFQSPGTAYQGQPPLYQQQGTVVVPVYRQRWNNLVATPVTSSLRIFFIISGIMSLICGILDMGIETGILLHSHTTYYRGLWVGGILVGGGISMLVAACRTCYIMAYLIRMFVVTLVFIILGLILSIVNLTSSIRCDSYYWYYCDDQLAINLKIVILVLFIISTIQTIVNIIVVSNAQKRAMVTPAPNVPCY